VAIPVKAAEPTTRPAEALAKLSEPARGIVSGQADVAALDALVAAGRVMDAVRFTAMILPRRERVWWAAQCVRSVPAAIADPKAIAVLEAVEKWAAGPKDELRRSAFTLAEAADIGTPAGCVGAAVFFSEGSIGPTHVAEIPPPPHAAPSAAANAALLAAVIAEPEKAAEKHAAFVELGRAVAAGTNRWAEAKPAASAPATAARPGAPAPPRPPTTTAPRPGYSPPRRY
jgi:hypothetical protein